MDGNEGEQDIEIIRYTKNEPNKATCIGIPSNNLTKNCSMIKVESPINAKKQRKHIINFIESKESQVKPFVISIHS